MNPGIGAPELIILLILALVVVGPKDLPLMMRKVGRFVGQARSMAREFQRGFDELGREAEMEELRKEIEALKDSNPASSIRRELKDVEQELRDVKSEMTHPRVGKPQSKPVKPQSSASNDKAKIQSENPVGLEPAPKDDPAS